MLRALRSIVLVFLALAPPARAATVAVVVADDAAARTAKALAKPGVSVLVFDRLKPGDPIEKGRFLAEVQGADRVITATGGKACGWIARETEGVLLHCVVPYDARQVLNYARSAGWRRVVAIHMEGYEKVYARMRKQAKDRGIELVPARVERIRELPDLLPGAMKGAQALWIVADPLLTEGAAYDYALELSLARKIPLIAPGRGQLARGAFLAAESDPAAMVRHAVEAANAATGGKPPEDSDTEAGSGRLYFNRVLARRWGLRIPEGSP